MSLGLLLASHVGSMLVDTALAFTLLQILAGIGGGAVYSLVLTALSDSRQPDRCFGFSVVAQVSFRVSGLLLFVAAVGRRSRVVTLPV